MSFQTGRTYGNYEFIDLLDRSQDGVTYKVRNILASRLEALRVLPRNLQDDQERMGRFLREIRVHASVLHPNVVTFYTALELENQLVTTSELVEGITLAMRLELGPMRWQEAVACLCQVLAGLACAHAHGIVHRDLVPAKIILTPGAVRLSGFSLAKRPAEPQLTAVGTLVGSPRYISPEQVRGVATLDARSDIYSAGVVLYEALTGHPPFDAKSQFDIMAAHVNAIPRAPSEVNPAVPKELDAVVRMALAKDPAQRFQTADEFRLALQATQAAWEAPQAQPVAQAVPAPAVPLSVPLFARVQAGQAGPLPREVMLAGVFVFVAGVLAFLALR